MSSSGPPASALLPEVAFDYAAFCHRVTAATVDWVLAYLRLRVAPPEHLPRLQAAFLASVERRRAVEAEGAAAGALVPAHKVVATFGLESDDRLLFDVLWAAAVDGRVADECRRLVPSAPADGLDVDVLVRVAGDSPADGPKLLSRLLPDAPLVLAYLVELRGQGPLLTRRVALAGDVLAYLLGHTPEDEATGEVGRVFRPEQRLLDAIVSGDLKAQLLGALSGCFRSATPQPSPPIVLIRGPEGVGKTVLARGAARDCGAGVVELDGRKLARLSPAALEYHVARACRTARLIDAVVIIDPADPVLAASGPLAQALVSSLRTASAAVLVTCESAEASRPLTRLARLTVGLESPSAADRAALWEVFLPPEVPLMADVNLVSLAEQFEFDGRRIAKAAAFARDAATTRQQAVSQDDLRQGAWVQLRESEGRGLRRPRQLGVDALVLPDDCKSEVLALLDACRSRAEVLSRWGFSRTLTTGKAVTALLVGEPGTGKTLCADVLAGELGQPVLEVSIPDILSKWIGETEQRLREVFAEARARQAVLLFDEADSLLTNRVRVETSSDRYSNIQVNVFLQEIDRYEGILLLTTNLDRNMDEALRRRILFKIVFPFPNATLRASLWERIIPAELPLAGPIDHGRLGRNFELAGGHIRNAVLRSAYAAMSRGMPLAIHDFEQAASLECLATGKLVRSQSASPYAGSPSTSRL